MAFYNVIFTRSAERDLERIDRAEDRQRITARIVTLADNPRAFGVEKLSGSDRTYRLRQGDYRVVFDIFDADLRVLVLRVRHRRDVYRRG